MAEPAERLPTFEELYVAIEALRPGLTGEILRPGTMRVMGRPGLKHRVASRRIARSLEAHDRFEGGTGWWIEVEAEIRFGEYLLVPDLAGWRLTGEPDFADENPIVVRPDWVCEILSRSTQRGDRAEKLPIYAGSGVGHAWIVDPATRTLEVYALVGTRYQLAATHRGSETVLLPPFEDPIDLGAWWEVTAPR